MCHCLRGTLQRSSILPRPLCHQGALYVILGESKSSLITKRSWDVMNRLWPRLVQAQHSEKPSDLQLVDTIIDKLHKNIETTELATKVEHQTTSVRLTGIIGFCFQLSQTLRNISALDLVWHQLISFTCDSG